MHKIDVKQVVCMHEILINQIGGLHGVKDVRLLDSAVNSIYQTFDGQELYPSVEQKAERLGYNLINNHAFIDGNKRVGMLAMLTFLEVNGVKLKYSDNELIEIGFSVATGAMHASDLHEWIQSHKIANKNNDMIK